MPAWLLLQLPCWMSLARPEPSLSVLPRAMGWELHGDGDGRESLNQRHSPYSLRSSVFMPINQSGSKSLRSKWFLILWKLAIHASKHPINHLGRFY